MLMTLTNTNTEEGQISVSKSNDSITMYGELTRGEIAAIRIKDALDTHLSTCEQFKKIVYGVVGAFFLVFVAAAGHVIMMTGRQEVMISNLDTINQRLVAIVSAANDRDNNIASSMAISDSRTRESLNEIRSQIRDIERTLQQQQTLTQMQPRR